MKSVFTPLQLWRFSSVIIQLQDLGTNSNEQYQYALPLMEEIVERINHTNTD